MKGVFGPHCESRMPRSAPFTLKSRKKSASWQDGSCHFEKVTGRKAGNAQSDAHATRIATQHVSAPRSNNPQLALQGPVEGEVVLLGAAPCGAVPENLMGDTGFEPVTPRV